MHDMRKSPRLFPLWAGGITYYAAIVLTARDYLPRQVAPFRRNGLLDRMTGGQRNERLDAEGCTMVRALAGPLLPIG